MIFAVIITLLSLATSSLAKNDTAAKDFAIVPHKNVRASENKPSFYYQAFAFESTTSYNNSWAKPVYSLIHKLGHKTKNYHIENGLVTYVFEDKFGAEPFFEISVTLKIEHPNMNVRSYPQRAIRGYTAMYIGKVKKHTSSVPDLCKIPHDMRSMIRESDGDLKMVIDKDSRAVFSAFALPISNGASFSFVEEAEITSDGVWVAVVQICTKHKHIKSQFTDNQVGTSVNTRSNLHNAPWISASVKILGHNPHGFLSADLMWTVPFDLLMLLAAIVISITFSAVMAIHRKNVVRYHTILLVCAFLSTAYVASHLRSDIAANSMAKNHFAHSPSPTEKADAILRTVLATALRFALGLFALGYAHLDKQSRDTRSLVVMCAMLTAFACSFAIWQLKFERVTSFSAISPWMFVSALIDGSYNYFLLENALKLMQRQRKEKQFAKLALYKRVAALIVVVAVCQGLAIAVRIAVPFDKLSLHPGAWPLCMLLGPCYETILLLIALSGGLTLLRPTKHSQLYRDSREVPTTSEAESHTPHAPPLVKLPEKYHDSYHCMA